MFSFRIIRVFQLNNWLFLCITFNINFIISILLLIMTYPTSIEFFTLLAFKLAPPLIMLTAHFWVNVFIFHLSSSLEEISNFLLNYVLFFFFCFLLWSHFFLILLFLVFLALRLNWTHWKVFNEVGVIRVGTFGFLWAITVNIIVLIFFINKELFLLSTILLDAGCCMLAYL